MECFSPFTAVNGAVWPVVEVEPTTYRFRMLNGSNARTYRLVLTRDGEPDHGRISQIGTEGGLLLAPAPPPAQGLVLASAERADLLVDFSDLAPGTELTLWNTATAPFDGTFADPVTAGRANLDGLLPYPEVLRIRVVDGRRRESRPTPQVLATDFQRVIRDELDGVVLRAIALVEQTADVEGEPPMLTLRELVEDPDSAEGAISLVEQRDGDETRETRWRTVATRFEDTVTFFPVLGQPEIWRLVNHCHILEHEDHDMMRPFVVMPAELMPFMGMHT
jgi:FtsP/CotA-like multicopper oxidase with cupredoxin domain